VPIYVSEIRKKEKKSVGMRTAEKGQKERGKPQIQRREAGKRRGKDLGPWEPRHRGTLTNHRRVEGGEGKNLMREGKPGKIRTGQKKEKKRAVRAQEMGR